MLIPYTAATIPIHFHFVLFMDGECYVYIYLSLCVCSCLSHLYLCEERKYIHTHTHASSIKIGQPIVCANLLHNLVVIRYYQLHSSHAHFGIVRMCIWCVENGTPNYIQVSIEMTPCHRPKHLHRVFAIYY